MGRSPTAVAPAPPRPPASRRIADFDQLLHLFRSWQGRFEQLSFGRFDATLRTATGRHLHALQATMNQAVRVRGRDSPGTAMISLVTPRSEQCVWQGRHFDAGRVVVLGGDDSANHQTARGAVSLQFTVREDWLRRAVVRETGDDPGPLGWQSVLPAPAAYARLEGLVRRFLDDPGSDDGIEEACVRAAIDALFPPTGSPRRDGLPLGARWKLARRAEELMRDRLCAPLTEEELCRELGARGRTLRLAFREQFGMGPMAYLQTLRLNAVRAVLKATDRGELPVASVAHDLGFRHLGKFAGYYRRLFGELPSATWGG